ncbi:uncharacterized protein LOC133037051 [Cannabis sativa]|uniref:uncharacterized protein LOC133037051 n=1 Tax=Cannabis sativa TaxID=3483 RepID=UPI0029CA368E|nr:uncharacterized protein LOC133037051 [Cannabis sativa]
MKGADFWEYELKGDVSWYWKKIFLLRKRFSKHNVIAAVTNGKFRASRLYNGLLQQNIDCYDKAVWCNLLLPKHRFILWQVVHGHLLTRDNFSKFHIELETKGCHVCNFEEESHSHLFFSCRYSRIVVQRIFDWCGYLSWPLDFNGWLCWLSSKNPGIIILVIAVTVYMIWKNRNHCVYNDSCYIVLKSVKEIKHIVHDRVYNMKDRKVVLAEKGLFLRLLQ